jgi:hypothetical protein
MQVAYLAKRQDMEEAERRAAEREPHVFEHYMREKQRLKALVKQVLEMRGLQKAYFASREQYALLRAKNAEKMLDEMLAALAQQGYAD